ncbi:MAG: IS3 family transposase [Sulfuriferula sp.]|nr:IS3 family transposase [Sulfuriferula sp.]
MQSAFNANNKCYGNHRLMTTLRAKSINVGRYKIRRIMRDLNIKPAWKRKFVNITDNKHNPPAADNLVNHEFNPCIPNRA